MRRKATISVLVLYALGFVAAAAQSLIVSGASLDGALFAGTFGSLAASAGGLAWAVYQRRRHAMTAAAAIFALLGAPLTMLGFIITIMGIDAVDSYVLPVGLLSLALGVVNLVAAWAAWNSRGVKG